ncbi:MAG: porin, partial [Psychromonas sp.]
MKTTKKFLLTAAALAVITSTSAFAGIKLIETNDITVDMNGDIDLLIKNMDDSEGTQIEANFDDLDFTFTYVINEDLKIIAETDFTSEFEDGNPVENAGAWVGFAYNEHNVQAGYQEISFDPLGIDNAEIMPTGMASGDTDGAGTEHESSIQYKYLGDKFWVAATYGKPEDSSSGTDSTIPEVYQIAAMANIDKLQIAGGVGHTETIENDVTMYESTYGQAEAEYDYGNGTVALLLSHEDQDVTSAATNVKTTGVEFDVTYKLTNDLTLVAGAERLMQDFDSEKDYDDLDTAYIGTRYQFNKFVTLYTEVGMAKGDFWGYGKTEPKE